MRKVFTLFFLFTATFFIQMKLSAQVNLYSFAASSGTYTPISGTSVFAAGWDDFVSSVPLGFNFSFNGSSYNTCSVNTNGYLTFGTTVSSSTTYTPISSTTTYTGAVAAWGRDLQAQNTAPLGVAEYTSVAGVFTLQWSNTRRYISTTVNTERFEMQIQLIQATGQIKIIYGNWSDAMSATTALVGEVGLRGASNADYKNISVAAGGDWTAPTLDAANNVTAYYNQGIVATKPALGLTYTFNPPAACAAPTAQATGLSLASSFSTVSGNFTAASPAPTGYLIVQTSGAALNTLPVTGTGYSVGSTLGNGTIVSSGSAVTFSATGLAGNTSYTYTVFAYYNSSTCFGPAYLTSAPLAGTISTSNTLGNYTWTGATSKDYQVATNWTPNRSAPDPSDLLNFTDGITDSVQNIPTQTVGRITV